MSDEASEIQRAKWWLAIVFAFLASMIYSCNELRYWAFGSTTNATILEMWEKRSSKNDPTSVTGYEVRYRFTEPGGTIRTETDVAGRAWQVPSTPIIPVRYLEGSPEMSRLAERHNWGAIAILGIMLIALIVKTILFLREYYADQRALEKSRAMSRY